MAEEQRVAATMHTPSLHGFFVDDAPRSQRRFFLSCLCPRFFSSPSLFLSFSYFLLFFRVLSFSFFSVGSHRSSIPWPATAAFVNGLQGPDASFPGKNNNSSASYVAYGYVLFVAFRVSLLLVCFLWRAGSFCGTMG